MTLSRRRLFGLLGGAGVAGAALGVAVPSAAPETTVPFFGAHQAGIVTPAQDRLHFAAFDLSPAADRASLVALLTAWTQAAARLTQGAEVGSGATDPALPPEDTGEALGLAAARLTLTFGFGTSLFDGRFGLAGQRPAQLADLPVFPGDALKEAVSGGDLCVQACSDDPQVGVHAIRNLARLARGTASVRWSQLGFGRTSSTSTDQATPRNLMGFKDGTANLKADTDFEKHVWRRRATARPG